MTPEHRKQIDALVARIAELEAALGELVALQDLREKHARTQSDWDDEQVFTAYVNRQPKAWDAARKALNKEADDA